MTALSPNVFLRDGAVFANSRDVAAFFDKRHDNVLRDIDNILISLGQNSGEADISSNLRGSLFLETTTADSYGRQQRSIDMTRDGFTLLAMGFTGDRALRFKLAYIDAFNRMEAELKRQTVLTESNGAELLLPEEERLWQGRLSLAQRIFGTAAARRLWSMSPLPQVADISAAEDGDDDLDPQGCLQHLLDWQPAGGKTIADLLTDAAPSALRRHGLAIDLKGWQGWVAIAASHPDLVRLYRATRWAGAHNAALLRLPQARRHPGVVKFKNCVSRAILIPLNTLDS